MSTALIAGFSVFIVMVFVFIAYHQYQLEKGRHDQQSKLDLVVQDTENKPYDPKTLWYDNLIRQQSELGITHASILGPNPTPKDVIDYCTVVPDSYRTVPAPPFDPNSTGCLQRMACNNNGERNGEHTGECSVNSNHIVVCPEPSGSFPGQDRCDQQPKKMMNHQTKECHVPTVEESQQTCNSQFRQQANEICPVGEIVEPQAESATCVSCSELDRVTTSEIQTEETLCSKHWKERFDIFKRTRFNEMHRHDSSLERAKSLFSEAKERRTASGSETSDLTLVDTCNSQVTFAV